MTQLPPELFAQRPVRSEYHRGRKSALHFRRLTIIGIAFLVLIGLGFGIFISMREEMPTDDVLPEIQAAFPIKERPEHPGGIDIPHQDVEVFEQLDNKTPQEPKSAVEHLLPAPQTPQPVTEETTVSVETEEETTKTAEAPEKSAEAVVTEIETITEELPPAVKEAAPEKLVVKEIAPLKEVAKVPEVKAEPVKKVEKSKAKTTKPTVIKAKSKSAKQADKAEQAMARLPKELFTGEKTKNPILSGKLARVQLASFKDGAVAEKEIARYTKRFSSSLAGAELEVLRADIPNRGIYYRIMTKKIAVEKAEKICNDLKKNQGSCLVLR
ncbi:MAG TPA: hypothetical protein DD400_01620 [Rhodospirillaceae bacterium]|nr:hypothetical protein [Rhodospirillaceae bacterium]